MLNEIDITFGQRFSVTFCGRTQIVMGRRISRLSRTADIAIRAAMTGNIVSARSTRNGCRRGLTALLDMDVEQYARFAW